MKGYPEDQKYMPKVQKFKDEFLEMGDADLDEEDDPTGLKKQYSNSEMLYGKKIEYLQQNPIDLLESKAGREELLRA